MANLKRAEAQEGLLRSVVSIRRPLGERARREARQGEDPEVTRDRERLAHGSETPSPGGVGGAGGAGGVGAGAASFTASLMLRARLQMQILFFSHTRVLPSATLM